MPDSFQYYNLPGGEMALGTAPLLSQLAPSLTGGPIVPPAAPAAAAATGGLGKTVGFNIARPAGLGGATGGGAINAGDPSGFTGGFAAGNTAVNPSLSSAARLALAIGMGGADAPISMLGGLALGDLFGGHGLLSSPFNVPGPSLTTEQQQQISAAGMAALQAGNFSPEAYNQAQIAMSSMLAQIRGSSQPTAGLGTTQPGAVASGPPGTGLGSVGTPGAVASGPPGTGLGGGTTGGLGTGGSLTGGSVGGGMGGGGMGGGNTSGPQAGRAGF